MKIVTSLSEIHDLSAGWKRTGEEVALVPTMGCLHEGHLSLMRKARDLTSKVIVSIFVNPIQFGPNEDFDAYPRQFEEDCRLAKMQGVDAVFTPDMKEMYDQSFQTKVSVSRLATGMCGKDRPGHFDGVATVVSKLFNLTIPDYAIFGDKDFQQLAIIRQMVKDLNFPVKIIGCPIVREADGLAMSSRNKYLTDSSRTAALSLSKAIDKARDFVRLEGQQLKASRIVDMVSTIVTQAGGDLEYAVVVDEFTLETEEVVGSHSILALAARIDNKVRLIDNGKLIID